MILHTILAGNFKLDGGAMFGVVPKSLWQKVYSADENNMCNLSLRLLLIEEGKRIILIDTGLGSKQDERFFGYYYLNGEDSLEKSLHTAGIKKDDITDVILTHLHFDHCGGAVEYDENSKFLKIAFRNATYWCSSGQWDWALSPNHREKASYLKENIIPIMESGQLKLFDNGFNITPNISIRLFNGHTNGLAVPFVNYHGRTIVFVADIIPTSAHIPLPWICGYDTRPLLSLEEKEAFLNEAVDNNFILFFEHDRYTTCCTLQKTEKGVRIKDRASNPDELL